MRFEEDKDHTFAKKSRSKEEGSNTPNIAVIFMGLLALVFIGFLAVKFGGGFINVAEKTVKKSITFRTSAKAELKEDKSLSSRTTAVLKEGTIVSGSKVGAVDGVAWAQVTSVDGASGFLPLSVLTEIGNGADLSQVQDVNTRIVVSTLINIREQPSLSSKALGTIDGGTRIIANGKVSSQGEEWFRISFGTDYNGFIMARFTTPDDDKASDWFYRADEVGNKGTIRSIVNIQATPFPDGRIIRAMAAGETVWIIGQTKAGDWWYIARLADGTQGFIPKTAVSVAKGEGKWVYPDGTEAPGPNIPQAKAKAPQSSLDAPNSDGENVALPEPVAEQPKVSPKPESGIDAELKQ